MGGTFGLAGALLLAAGWLLAREMAHREKAEREVRELAARTATVLDSIRDGVLAVDREWHIRYANQRALTTTVQVDAPGRVLWEALPGIAGEFEERLRHAMDSGASVGFVEAVAGDLFLDVHASPLPDGLVISLRDVTLQRRLENQLETERQRWELVLAGNNDGIFDADLTTGEVVYSDRWFEILGFPEENRVATNSIWESRIHPDDREAVLRHLDDYLARRTPAYRCEYRLRAEDGTYRWIQARGQAVWAPDGRPLRMVGSHEDITERREGEMALRRMRAALEEKVRELSEQTARASAASVAKSEFLAIVSHEVRTPMTAIIGITGLLEQSNLTPEQREWIGAIRSSGEALLRILDDILDFSSIEAGRLALDRRAFEPARVVEETVELLAEGALRKGLALSADIDAEYPGTVQGDPLRFRQILLNLVANAIKFTEQGEVSVILTCRPRADGSAAVQVEVRDTGIGIPGDAHQRLFRSFSQVDSSARRKHGGTGLGLAICRRLVDLMEGSIGVSSDPGRGSRFWFEVTLPIGRQDQEGTTTAPFLEGRTVLLADPRPWRAGALERCLRWAGARVRVVGDLVAAREALAETKVPYSLALLVWEGAAAEPPPNQRSGWPCPLLWLTPHAGVLSTSEPWLRLPAKRRTLLERMEAVLRSGPTSTAELLDASAAVFSAGKPHILLVEDNPVSQRVVTLLVERLGYQVTIAGGGQAAVEAAATQPFAAILMDCQMPGMDGFEATRTIRAAEAGRRVPILALTADALNGSRERCFQAGMDDFITKPVHVDDLSSKLRQWISGAPAADLTSVLSGR